MTNFFRLVRSFRTTSLYSLSLSHTHTHASTRADTHKFIASKRLVIFLVSLEFEVGQFNQLCWQFGLVILIKVQDKNFLPLGAPPFNRFDNCRLSTYLDWTSSVSEMFCRAGIRTLALDRNRLIRLNVKGHIILKGRFPK